MIQDLNRQINDLKNNIYHIGQLLKIEKKRSGIEDLQKKMADSNFWKDQKLVSMVIGELKDSKSDVDDYSDLDKRCKDLEELLSLDDVSFEENIVLEIKKLNNDCEKVRLKVFFSGKFDNANAILEINSGAGGTEACDWAQMLFRMYFRWAENKGFKFKVLNEVKAEEAGLKNITFFIEGHKAYGMLKSERGVHRLVRISPFDSNKRRHTSFASVDVLPEIKEDISIEINPEDLKIDTFRSSGAGGQHVNVTDSAVRITYIPTGIIISCQNERSQHQNKQAALKILRAKLYKAKEEKNREELENVAGEKQKIEWGSQVRSYVLHPYLLVKDHRTNFENHNARAVLDGNIDGFIYAYLKYINQ